MVPAMTKAVRAVLFLLLLVPGIHAADARPLYAVCGAYPPEMEALLKEFQVNAADGWTKTTVTGVDFWRGTRAGKDLIIFRTGVSLVNAAYQLQLALDHFPITHVLFAGVAGGVDPALHIGDVVIPARWAYHSEAAYLNEDGKGGYVVPEHRRTAYENFGMIFPNDVKVRRDGDDRFEVLPAFPADDGLLEVARRVAPELPPMRKGGRDVSILVGGTGVAGPVFLDNAKYREWVFRVWSARCLDMESTALAHVAYVNRKPFLIVRSLSDLAGGQPGPNHIKQNEAQVAEIAARVLRAIVDAH